MSLRNYYKERAGLGLSIEEFWPHHRELCLTVVGVDAPILNRLRAAVTREMERTGRRIAMPQCFCYCNGPHVSPDGASFVTEAVCDDFGIYGFTVIGSVAQPDADIGYGTTPRRMTSRDALASGLYFTTDPNEP